MELSQIYRPVQEDLDKTRDLLRSISRIDFPWLSEQLSYVIKGSGKGIRPALTLLSGNFYNYNLTYLLPMAVSVELMHTATLVHDDAIDKAAVRRGNPTINKLWGDDIAVLLGDYLFAKAGEFVSDTRNPRVIKLFSQTLATISSGEINQFLWAFKTEQTMENYIHRISSKTASLFALATESGAILSRAPEKAVKALREYGYNLGIAFQIVDDILDFTGTEEMLGKPVGSDLAQGTLTLPAMLLLQRYPEDNPVRNLFEHKSEHKNEDGQKNIARAIAMVCNSSVIEECNKVAQEYCTKARQNLEKLPENVSRQALIQLADYVVERKL